MSSSFFENVDCLYYPCHDMGNEKLNCLFCYCPLYMLGRDCGGNFAYLEDGTKDCSCCTIPHGGEGYLHILRKFEDIKERMKKDDERAKEKDT